MGRRRQAAASVEEDAARVTDESAASQYLSVAGWEAGVPTTVTLDRPDRWAIQRGDTVDYFCRPAGVHLRLVQKPSLIAPQRAGFGAVLWEAAFALAEWIGLQPHGFFAGKRVIELGAGVGLVAQLLAHLGANVTATDVAEVMPILKENVDQAQGPLASLGSCGSLNCAVLRWGDRSEFAGEKIDLIVASDSFYSKEAVAPFMASLRDLSTANTVAYVCFEVRGEEVLATFEAETASLRVCKRLSLLAAGVPAAIAAEHLRMFELRA